MAIHSHILHNGEIHPASEPRLYAGQLGLLAGWGVFSTLRVEQGQLFAWERHWDRMSRDAKVLNVPMPADAAAVERDLMMLLAANNIAGQGGRCTMRIVIVRNKGGLWEGPSSGQPSDILALTANMKDWAASIRLDVTPNARYAASEFTNTKILTWAHNLRWAERAAEKGFDETILLNERGVVAECTSANIFAIFGSEVLTPPLSDGCLPGITREVLVDEIHLPGITVRESSLTIDHLCAADEVFITSSTRDLLSVREIAGRQTNQRGVVRARISEALHEYVLADVARRGKATLVA